MKIYKTKMVKRIKLMIMLKKQKIQIPKKLIKMEKEQIEVNKV